MRVLGTPLAVQRLRLDTPNAGGLVPSLVRELEPACCNKESCMPQLKIKILHAAVKTQGSQINILKKRNESVDFSIRFISHIFFKGVIFIFRNAQPIVG